MEWTQDDLDTLTGLWSEYGGRIVRIAKAMNRSNGSIAGKAMRLMLQFHGGRSITLRPDHAAVVEGRTVHRKQVTRADGFDVLKPGINQRKLGGKVAKGAWRGMPIYSLTLEERRTCPRSCAVWAECYGNNMSNSKRFVANGMLMKSIKMDLNYLQRKHPAGFVVRLHILGDFYSVAYVDFWADMLDRFPALRVFGYTARQFDDVTGERITALREWAWDRFAVRTSGLNGGSGTIVIDRQDEAPEAIICPAQTQRTTNCSTCGLCWSPAAKHRTIAFLRH